MADIIESKTFSAVDAPSYNDVNNLWYTTLKAYQKNVGTKRKMYEYLFDASIFASASENVLFHLYLTYITNDGYLYNQFENLTTLEKASYLKKYMLEVSTGINGNQSIESKLDGLVWTDGDVDRLITSFSADLDSEQFTIFNFMPDEQGYTDDNLSFSNFENSSLISSIKLSVRKIYQ